MLSKKQKQMMFDFYRSASNDNSKQDEATRKFREYHAENPHIYDLIEEYAFKAIDAGFEHYSIVCIANVIRWHTDVVTRGDSFKINNNYLSRYARMFHDLNPQHDGFFRTRELIKGAA